MGMKRSFRWCLLRCVYCENSALAKKKRTSRKILPCKRSPSFAIVHVGGHGSVPELDMPVENGKAASKEDEEKFCKPITTAWEFYGSLIVHSVQAIQKEFQVDSDCNGTGKQAEDKIEKSKKIDSDCNGKRNDKEVAAGGNSLMDFLQCENFELKEEKPMNSEELTSVQYSKGEAKMKSVGTDSKFEKKKNTWPIMRYQSVQTGWYPVLHTIPEVPSPLHK